MVSRCDFYSDEEYEYAKQMEYDEFQEALAMEEEMKRLAYEEYLKEQEADSERSGCENVKHDSLILSLADGLKMHCQSWGYDFVEKLEQKPTPENFIKTFCKITCTYYFTHQENMYGAKFRKGDLSVQIYKCGKNHEEILLECPIGDVIKELFSFDGNKY